MKLLCVIWHCSVPTLHFSVSHDTNMYYIKLFCPKMRQLCSSWDSSVPHEKLCPTWDSSFPLETALFQIKLLYPIWDCSGIWDCFVLYETALCYMRLFCPTWDCSVPHEVALSHMRLLFPCHFWIIIHLDGTDLSFLGLGHMQDWDNPKTESFLEEMQAKSSVKFHIEYLNANFSNNL